MNLPGIVVVSAASSRFSDPKINGIALVSLAAMYETYALATGKVPTISGHVKKLSRHRIIRYAVMFGMGYCLHHLLVGDGS